MLLAQCEADLPFMHDIQHECFGLAHAMAEPDGCPLRATPMGGVPPHQLGEQFGAGFARGERIVIMASLSARSFALLTQ
jgi:hypothetical protein